MNPGRPSTTSEAFVGSLGILKEGAKEIGKPLVVVLDNASIHKAKEVRHLVEFLVAQGVSLCFLPPYSPELNRIERL
jgi:transposase